MGSIMLNKPLQSMNNMQAQLGGIMQQVQRMGPQNFIQQSLASNPQLAQKYNMLMQMNQGKSPTEIATMMLQERGIDPSTILGR